MRHACVVRWLVRPGRRRRSLWASHLGGLAGSSPRLRRLHVPGPRCVIFWTFPQSSPSLSAAHSMASPTPEYYTTAFQVHRGGSNPLSPLFPSCPDAGGLSSLSPGPSRPSVYLTDPSLAGTPRPGASYGSFLYHESHREWKAFLTALTRLLVMIGSLPHRSHAHIQLSVPVTLQQTASSLSPISRSGTSDTWRSEAVATPPTYTIHISLASGSMLPKGP